MKNIPIAIADDDAGMRAILKKLIDRDGGYEFVGEAGTGEDMLQLYDRLHPKVVILDVEMPGISGLECARTIQDRDPHTIIVFTTAHEKYMQDAFELYAFDYLIKPFRQERASNTLELIRERLAGDGAHDAPAENATGVKGGKLILRNKDGVSFVKVSRIVLIQREERMTAIYTTDGRRYLTGDNLSEIEEKLPPELFFRSHKSYIINIDQIDSITPYGRWTYVVKLENTTQDALITHEKLEELEKRFD